jgi:hypothetical protein
LGVSPRTKHQPNCPEADAQRLAFICGFAALSNPILFRTNSTPSPLAPG